MAGIWLATMGVYLVRRVLVLPKNQVDEKLPSKISSMPESLLNGLTREQILDLVAYLKAGGNPADPVFQAPGQK